jgi:hypothetical protein
MFEINLGTLETVNLRNLFVIETGNMEHGHPHKSIKEYINSELT